MISKITYDIKKPKELFFGLFLLTSFISTPYQLDNFYAIGWFYLSLIVFLSVSIGLIKSVEIYQLLLFLFIPLIYALSFKVDLDQLGIYLILFYSMICDFKYKNTDRTELIIIMNIIFSIWSVFLILSLINLFKLGYNHLNTYKSIVYFSNRNIFLEYGVLLTYLFTQWNSFSLKQKLIIRFIYSFIVFIFQAKAALLASILLMFLNHPNIRRPLFVCLIILISYNIPNIYKYTNHRWDYFKELEKKNVVSKNLDIIYNLRYSGSASDRINTYDWTLQNLNFLGHGIGSWKYDAMGKIQVADGLGTLHRRPHNEFLLILYEFGILLGSLYGLQILIFFRRNKLLFILPIVFLSFPFERSEFVSLMFFSSLFKQDD